MDVALSKVYIDLRPQAKRLSKPKPNQSNAKTEDGRRVVTVLFIADKRKQIRKAGNDYI